MTKVIMSLICLFVAIFHRASGQDEGQCANVEKAFDEIPSRPGVFHFTNTIASTPATGHLQGVQGWITGGLFFEYSVLITANSKRFSYLVSANFAPGKKNISKVEMLKHLLEAPYSHAGGCQLSGGKLFVGIEDNMLKDKSKLVVVGDTVQVIANRQGAYKRSTAGATAACETGDRTFLVIVGDWDSKNFDCYRYVEGGACDSFATFQLADSIKKCSYQSINLLRQKGGIFYLIGTGTDATGSRADLFRLDMHDNKVQAVWLKTRYFKCTHGCSFRFGAGIAVDDSGRINIYATQRRLGSQNAMNVFQKPQLLK
jgi:hypothetical protein